MIALIVTALIFDWGRKEFVVAPDLNSEATSTASTSSPIFVSYPIDNQVVTNPIYISGTVKGNWFFEGSFPVQLIDSNGAVITTALAHTDGDWMTTDYVNFSATLEYPKATTTERALILLKNDNPSGDPARDQEKFIPVTLK